MDSNQSSTDESPFSLISKGWRDVRESATNDLKLIKSRASLLISIADRDFSELELVKKFQPKISELRRTVWDEWGEKSTVRIDLSAIRKAIEDKKDGFGFGGIDRRLTLIGWIVKENHDVNCDSSDEIKERVPIQRIKTRWKEIEQKNLRTEVLDSLKASEFVEKIKLTLRSPHKDSHQSKDDQDSDYPDLRIALQTNSPNPNPPNPKRHITIVTTASLPWLTGTAVNPLLRAAYLAKSTNQNVTLLIPWLNKSDQDLVYPDDVRFESPLEQQGYIRNWLQDRVGFKPEFKISFYPGKFSRERRSILPSGDTCAFVPASECDIAVLEEPEHLNWYHHGASWRARFRRVVGVVHTNYLEYIKRERNGVLRAWLVSGINSWLTRAYCHKVLRLSAATQDLPKSVICNVHGVNPKFLRVGEKIAREIENGNDKVFSKGAYFLGKMVWAKGYRELIDLMSKHRNELQGLSVDVYGNGEDSTAVQFAAKSLDLNVNFFKGRDHSDDSLHSYKVFINPSVSDVLCTATAEALAMGKTVICADHPSNSFFTQFPNCLTYKSSDEFVTKVNAALTSQPFPLTPSQLHTLSWEAATERFLEYSGLREDLYSRGKMGNGKRESGLLDGGLALLHNFLTGSEMLRVVTGAEPGTRDFDRKACEELQILPADDKQEEVFHEQKWGLEHRTGDFV